MTKLMEWLTVTTAIFGTWYYIVGGYIQTDLLDKWMYLIIPAPLIALIIFGVYAACTVLYRVFTFNDCEDAAKELQNQIQEAKKDLKAKGFAFASD